MAAKKKQKVPTPKELRELYELVRNYCRRERADVDVGSPEMVEDWWAICRRVGVKPEPRWS